MLNDDEKDLEIDLDGVNVRFPCVFVAPRCVCSSFLMEMNPQT